MDEGIGRAACRVRTRLEAQSPLYRAIATILTVAVLSCGLSHIEQAQGERRVPTHWVRTADGWEPSGVLQFQHRSSAAPLPHPLLVACFQLGASLFVLLAFPGAKFSSSRIQAAPSAR